MGSMNRHDRAVLNELALQPEDDPWVKLPQLRQNARLTDLELLPSLDRLVSSGDVLHEWRVGVRGGAYRIAQESRLRANKLSGQYV